MGGFNDAIVKGAVRPFGDRIRLAKTPFITAQLAGLNNPSIH